MTDRADHLRSLEHAMWHIGTRGDAAWMADHASDDFLEYGRSGLAYDRSAVLDVSNIAPFDAELSSIDVAFLTEDVALLTYRSAFHRDGAGTEFALRASVWTNTSDGWRLRFHQGTPCPDWR